MSKTEAEKIFRTEILSFIRERYEKGGRRDLPARREAWNNFTDQLCKAGSITLKQYETWRHPSCNE